MISKLEDKLIVILKEYLNEFGVKFVDENGEKDTLRLFQVQMMLTEIMRAVEEESKI